MSDIYNQDCVLGKDYQIIIPLIMVINILFHLWMMQFY